MYKYFVRTLVGPYFTAGVSTKPIGVGANLYRVGFAIYIHRCTLL
jgi:hypothetical protein